MSAFMDLVVMTPTPNEHRAVSRHLGAASFKNLSAKVVECGPGRINAAFAAAREFLGKKAHPGRQAALVGAGTAGSLSLELAGGDMIASNSAVISDWRLDDGGPDQVSPYGRFDYQEPDPRHVERMALECQDPLVLVFLAALPGERFKRGRMLTSEAFVAGKERKLSLGRTYGCLACDMESGAFGYLAARHLGVPWLNFRVVADTLDDALSDYFAMERDMTDVLGRNVAAALAVLDELLGARG
jgi:nucleoside phosphorylase